MVSLSPSATHGFRIPLCPTGARAPDHTPADMHTGQSSMVGRRRTQGRSAMTAQFCFVVSCYCLLHLSLVAEGGSMALTRAPMLGAYSALGWGKQRLPFITVVMEAPSPAAMPAAEPRLQAAAIPWDTPAAEPPAPQAVRFCLPASAILRACRDASQKSLAKMLCSNALQKCFPDIPCRYAPINAVRNVRHYQKIPPSRFLAPRFLAPASLP